MLILGRVVGEQIKIGEDITVTVLDVSFKRVKIGIDAPKKIAVHRSEIYDKINEQES